MKLNKSKKRVSVFLDNSASFVVGRQVAEEAGLRKGLVLSDGQMKDLMEADLSRRCFDAALRFLAYRPRSEMEMKQRLYKHGFNDDTISNVLVRLRKKNLINDVVFAQYWKDNRLSLNPRSQRLIKYELIRKGIHGEIADEAIEGLDDRDNAYKAGLKKARLLSSLSYAEFCKRLFNYLRWRGFNYEVIVSVSERLWQEKHSGSE